MPRVRLLHWNAQEAEAHIAALRRSKFTLEYDERNSTALMKSWRERPPDAFVIDLSRLPSHGREIAIALRQSPRTRCVPIVFCGGSEEKVNTIRSLLPDAVYCSLPELVSALRRAIKDPPTESIKPLPMMERYAHRTAAQKLGIVEFSRVSLVDAPPNALKILGELPSGVEISEDSTKTASVMLCFLHHAHSVGPTFSEVRHFAATIKLWALWRKGGTAAHGDVTERLVRESALDLGMVDYKICSVDSLWTAMLFARRK